jgi:hypothetical protein
VIFLLLKIKYSRSIISWNKGEDFIFTWYSRRGKSLLFDEFKLWVITTDDISTGGTSRNRQEWFYKTS